MSTSEATPSDGPDGPEIRFYHLTRLGLDEALPGLLRKCLERDWRAVVMAGSPERVAALDARLWQDDPDGFLPHGTADDGHAADQPVWLTARAENPNGAHVLFLTDGAEIADPAAFGLVCLMFDGRDPQALSQARARWAAWKAAGRQLTYWRQTDRGAWEKAAQTQAAPPDRAS